MKAILGKKVGMTQVFDAAGAVHPVTVVRAGPCHVLQVKTATSDGYDAVQMGLEDLPPARAKRPQIGHAAKANLKPKRFVREFRLDGPEPDLAAGQEITVDVFDGVGLVTVAGISKGKGFAGVMKRHNFKGMPDSHGTERKHRSPGALSGHAGNRGKGRIKRGKRMAGHMGMDHTTVRNAKLVAVDRDNHLLLIRGALPGPSGGLLCITECAKAKAT